MVNNISFYTRLSNLEKRNNGLKSLLLRDQLKHGSYSYKRLEDKILLILNEYKINKSLTMAAFNNGFNPNLVLKWFVEGQKGNPNFKIFYEGIKRINNFEPNDEDLEFKDDDYEIEYVGGSWVYTTYVDGEKIAVISSNLKHLKEKVSNKNLPIYLT